MVRRASDSARDEGGPMRTCRVILILAMWPIAPVLFVAFAFRQGAACVSVIHERREQPRAAVTREVLRDFVDLMTCADRFLS